MLDNAIKYSDEIQRLYLNNVLGNDDYKYWVYDFYWLNKIKIEDSDWNYIQRVSVDKDKKVLGYFTVSIDRASNKASSLSVLNFDLKSENIPFVFIKDLEKFIDYILGMYNKISFCVAIGNPAERLYDSFINKFGGKIVGIKRKEVKLIDGKYYDVKVYEVLQEEYKIGIDKHK